MKKSNKLLRLLLSSPLQTSGMVAFCYYILLIAVIAGTILLLSKTLEATPLPNVIRLVVILFAVTFVVLLFRKIFSIAEKRLTLKRHRNIPIDELPETLNLTAEGKNEEREILQGIVNFERISVDKIMKPRADIVSIDLKSDFETVIRTIRESEYSRLPVYEDSIDNVKGILYIKDLLKYIDSEPSFKWQPLIREAYFIPETKKIDDLLKEFQEKRIHLAVVAGESDGTLGIVTLEDILEVIVGDICDEHDEE